MTKAVIFDCGGVVHSQRDKKSADLVGEAFGLTAEQIEPLLGPLVLELSVGKISEKQFWKKSSDLLRKLIPADWERVWEEH